MVILAMPESTAFSASFFRFFIEAFNTRFFVSAASSFIVFAGISVCFFETHAPTKRNHHYVILLTRYFLQYLH